MILLGKYTTKNGKNYACHFLPDEKLMQAIGRLPDLPGARGVAFQGSAETEEEAKQKITEAINQGNL